MRPSKEEGSSSADKERSARGGSNVHSVLVTGGGGYIGCVLVRKLVSRGYAVRVLDQLHWGKEPLGDLIDQIELIQGDIRSTDDEWLRGIDAVVHLAGLSNDPTAEYDPQANWEVNAVGTERLAEACKRVGIRRLTFGSSCSLYDGLENGRTHEEDAEIHPSGGYAEGKRYAEERLRDLADETFCPTILRQGTVFGFSPRMRYDLVVNTFVKDAMKTGELQLHGRGRLWRPLVDVEDAAEAHIVCLEAPERSVRGEVFNVVQDNYQVRDLAALVARALRPEYGRVQLLEVPGPSKVRDYRCSNTKMTQVLGFTPRRTVAMSVANMVSWIKSDGYMAFDNPRFYNIRWMELLKERSQVSSPVAST